MYIYSIHRNKIPFQHKTTKLPSNLITIQEIFTQIYFPKAI